MEWKHNEADQAVLDAGRDQVDARIADGNPESCDAGLQFQVEGKRYRIQVANDIKTRMAAYRFINDIYTAKGYGKPNPSGMWYSRYEMLPGTVTITLVSDGNVVGAVTLASDSHLRLPADDAYQKELDEKRAAGYRMTEVMSLGICPRLRGQREILGRLFSFVSLVARFMLDSTHLVVTVVPHHIRFYVDQLLFVQNGEFGYHKKTGVTCALALVDLQKKRYLDAETRDRTFYRYFYTEEEAPELVYAMGKQLRPISMREVVFFLSQRPEIWFNAPDDFRAAILQSGNELNSMVMSA